ncbi:uncharacterized protein LOC126418603 [Schistocerca serialis cubense]|uniref:uncharacterized protein LOC126418603 n=1 Tax=Schistocerca serialis cubense TaxID=2023355 RepID=UPI00214E0601|nr:uncharacterized protein LOC126418603 [Schistocerca serialis cubense]
MTNRSVFARGLLVATLSVLALAAAAAAATESSEGDGDKSGPAAAPVSTEAPAQAVADPGSSSSTVGPPPPAAADSAAAGSDTSSVAVPNDVMSSGSAREGAASLADARFSAGRPEAGGRSSAVSGRSISSASGSPASWNSAVPAPAPAPVPAADAGQFHIQTDEGPERYFRYQTQSGQYRKEKRLQDGSVVGSYGWIGADGVLRLRDYVADNSGYRVVRTKSVYVGRDEPIGSALAKSKSAPSQGGTSYRAPIATAPPTPAPLPLSTPQQEPVRRPALGYSAPAFSFSPPASVIYPGYQPISSNAIQPQYSGLPSNYQYQTASPPAADRYDNAAAGYYQNTVQPPAQAHTQFPLYDGIATTQNGFRYYLPRQYQEEETLSQDRRAGSFGYIDPFGIRRVIYYNTAPDTGFVHRKNNRYVGFDATPYDPRF